MAVNHNQIALAVHRQPPKHSALRSRRVRGYPLKATSGHTSTHGVDESVSASSAGGTHHEEQPLFGHKFGKREKTHWITFMKRGRKK